MDEYKPFKESSGIHVICPVQEAEGKEWDVVLIETGLSKNGNFYPADVLQKATPLFEDLKACAYRFGDSFDHLPSENPKRYGGFAENVVGWFDKIRFGTFQKSDGSEGEGILGRFHVLEGAKWLKDNLRDAWEHGKAKLLGFSIDAQGQATPGSHEGRPVTFVEKIERVESTDVVSRPAAGGALLRLVASTGEKNMDGILNLIKKHRPIWLDGISNIKEDESQHDFVLRILESNLFDSKQVLDELSVDNVEHITEVARGVKTLGSVTDLFKSKRIEESFDLLHAWIAKHPVTGDVAGRIRESYSYPYLTQDIKEATPLGNFLRAEAKKQGISNDQLAQAAKISTEELLAIINGDNPKPPSSYLKAFSTVFEGVPFEKLLGLIPGNVSESIKESIDDKNLEDTENKMNMQEIQKKENEISIREAKILVKERLADSGLPENAKKRVIKIFEGKSQVTTKEIDIAIQEEREYISNFTESGEPKGLGKAHGGDNERIKVTQEEKEKIDKAWDGFFECEDIDGVPRFTSMKQAWGVINGNGAWRSPEQTSLMIFESVFRSLPANINDTIENPYELHKNYLKESWGRITTKSLREAVTTSDFPQTFGDALYRRLQKEYKQDPRNDWRKIVSGIENLKDATNKFKVIRQGSINDLPIVNEKAPYQEITPNSTEEFEEIDPNKRGGLHILTWEDMLADSISAIRKIPRVLAKAANRTVHKVVWDEIENNPTMQDGELLFSAAHKNILASTPSIGFEPVSDLIQLIREQKELDSNEKIGLMPAFLITGTKLERQAFEITRSTKKSTTTEDSTIDNSLMNQYSIQPLSTLGVGRTSAKENHYYVSISPKDGDTIAVGFLGGRDRPEIFVQDQSTPNAGAFFDADAITFKIRHVVGARVIDHRSFAASLTS